jgi:hypothetical protein
MKGQGRDVAKCFLLHHCFSAPFAISIQDGAGHDEADIVGLLADLLILTDTQ